MYNNTSARAQFILFFFFSIVDNYFEISFDFDNSEYFEFILSIFLFFLNFKQYSDNTIFIFEHKYKSIYKIYYIYRLYISLRLYLIKNKHGTIIVKKHILIFWRKFPQKYIIVPRRRRFKQKKKYFIFTKYVITSFYSLFNKLVEVRIDINCLI